MSLCDNGEDLLFLAHCAVTRKWDLLLEGYVKPEFMSAGGAAVAAYVLDARTRARSDGEWPPSYHALREHFSSLPWPAVPNDESLDPGFAASHVYYSVRAEKVAQLTALAYKIQESPISTPQFTEACNSVTALASDLRYLATPTPLPQMAFSNADDVIARLNGPTEARQAQFSSPWEFMQRVIAPVEPGLHGVFGRPGSGKSWALYEHAYHHAFLLKRRGLLVDIENSKSVILLRLVAIALRVDIGDIMELIDAAYAQRMTSSQVALRDDVKQCMRDLENAGGLYILGRDQIPEGQTTYSVEYIMQYARELDLNAIFADQVHKYTAEGLGTRALPLDHLYAVCARLSRAPFYSFVSTQEKRSPSAASKRTYTDDPEEIGSLVFGGDAMQQNAVALVQIAKWPQPGTSVLQRFLPVKLRNASARLHAPVFARTTFCSNMEFISETEGLAAIALIDLEKKMTRDSAKTKAAAQLNASRPADDIDPGDARPNAPRIANTVKAMTGFGRRP